MSDTKKTPAERWLDAEIGLGKLLEIEGCNRPSGDDLAGGLANAFCERLRIILRQLEDERNRSRIEYNESLKAGKEIDATAEIARSRAFTDAISMVNVQFGIVLDRKQAA